MEILWRLEVILAVSKHQLIEISDDEFISCTQLAHSDHFASG